MSATKGRTIIKIVLPIVILVLAVLGAKTLVAMKPEPKKAEVAYIPPLIRAQRVNLSDAQFNIASQGTVRPRVESDLVPEIAGRVVKISPALDLGGYFEAGEALVHLDPFDYRQAIIAAKADLAKAELALARTKAESRLAREEWEQLGEGEPDPLTLFLPQVADAEATVEAAKARLASAERNLERTVIKAPFAGRVLNKNVALGQFVNRGAPLARVYAIDTAEISLPVSNRDLAHIRVPFHYQDGAKPQDLPQVTITATIGNRDYQWQGRITRTDGSINPSTRMLNLIAEVADPYRRDESGRPPLAKGMFVQAQIEGVAVQQVAELPRTALWSDRQVLIVDEDMRLRFRDVEILRKTVDQVYISGGLQEGDQVVLSRLEAVSDGMLVRIAESPQSGVDAQNFSASEQ